MANVCIKKEFRNIFLLNLKKDSKKEDFESFFNSFTKIDKKLNQILEEKSIEKKKDKKEIKIYKDLSYYLKLLKEEILTKNSRTLKEIIQWNLDLIN